MRMIAFRYVAGFAILSAAFGPNHSPAQPEVAPPPKLVVLSAPNKSGFSAPEELDARVRGKQILFFDSADKETNKPDPTLYFSGPCSYPSGRDTYTYFIEPVPKEWRKGPHDRHLGPWKNQKVIHGLRIVYDEKGQLCKIENYYAGVPHGQTVWFQDGKRWYEITYKYGWRDGIARHYHHDGKILSEEEFHAEKSAGYRSFDSDGRPQ